MNTGSRQSQRARTVNDRADAVAGAYEMRARQLDHQHHGLPPPAAQRHQALVGPVLGTLRQFGVTRGVVWGTYAESSRDVQRLWGAAADIGAAATWREVGARSEKEGRGYYVALLRKRWGLAAAIGQARMRLARVPYVGLTRAQAKAMGAMAPASDEHNHVVSPIAFEADAADIGQRRQAQRDPRGGRRGRARGD